MSVDRIPDGPDPAPETARLTDSPQPETPPRPTPEPEHPSPPDQRQPPDREPKPERESQDEQQESETEHRPESPGPANEPDTPAPTDSPRHPTRDTPDAEDTAEPRSRQEHAAPPSTNERAIPTEDEVEDEGNGFNRRLARRARTCPQRHSRRPIQRIRGADSAEGAHSRTEHERAEHIADVFARLDKADAEGSTTNELHTVDPNEEIWSSDRTLLHHSLLDDIYSRSASVPCDREAIVAGGLSGAGKTTVLANHPEIDSSKYLTINPDNIKEEMARRGMIPEVEGLSPMEASDLVHEESSYLARQLAIRAQADGKNLIWDITMSDLAKTERRITDLREAGYTRIDALFVQIPIETSLERTEARYWADQDKWVAGEGQGGRLIPPQVILRQADEEWGSGNRKTFEAIKGIVNNWEIKDNSIDGRPATLVDRNWNDESHSSTTRSIDYEQ